MTGTILNVITILVGGSIGLFFGNRLPERIQNTVVSGLGLFVLAIGMQMFMGTTNPLVVLGSLMIGGLLGEWWGIERRLESLGGWLETHFGGKAEDEEPEQTAPDALPSRQKFIKGFLTASLIFCIGPMTILGSIQDGVSGNYELLAIKSILDGFASIAFAASLGVGVLFSALVVLGFQGGISLLAAQIVSIFPEEVMAQAMIPEMSAVGGVLLLGLSISSLLELRKIRVGNFLPALVIAPLIMFALVEWGVIVL